MWTRTTLSEIFEGFSQILKEQSGENRDLGDGCVYKPNSNNLKIWKPLYLKKNVHVPIFVDYTDMYFAIEYLREDEKVRGPGRIS